MPGEQKPSAQETVRDVQRTVGYFEPSPHLRIGDADSAHQVLFGTMPGMGGPVVVKPFSKPGKAQVESRNLIGVHERGFEALEPLAVAGGSLATYLITRQRPGLTHLGQVNWSANIASPHLKRVITPTLGLAGHTAATWHNAGITHGDLQVKNMVYDPNGTSVYVDAEKTQLKSGSAQLTHVASKDLGLLGLSVLSRGLLDDRSVQYRAGYLNEALLDPYFDVAKPQIFTVPEDQRRADLQAHWVGKMQSGYTPAWVGRQLDAIAAAPPSATIAHSAGS